MPPLPIKELIWLGTSLKIMRTFPEEVRQLMGYALYLAQTGGKHPGAKPLKGFGGAGVLEVVADFDGNTYRAIYTVIFDDVVYVLHAFRKKSKHGLSTPKRDAELVRQRLQSARQMQKSGSSGSTE